MVSLAFQCLSKTIESLFAFAKIWRMSPMDVYKKFEEVLSSEITIDKIEFTNGFLNIYLF